MKKKNFITYGLLVAAGVLLLGSAIGSTQAALTYYSENYTAEITISQIGVSLMENGKVVSSRDYNEDKWDISTNKKDSTSASGALLTNMLKKDEKLALNKKYDEVLRVKNSGINFSAGWLETLQNSSIHFIWEPCPQCLSVADPVPSFQPQF